MRKDDSLFKLFKMNTGDDTLDALAFAVSRKFFLINIDCRLVLAHKNAPVPPHIKDFSCCLIRVFALFRKLKSNDIILVFADIAEPLFLAYDVIRRTAKLRNFTCFFRVVTHSSERFYFCHIKNLQIVFRSSVSSPSV